jgi:hypothetical protein
MAEQYIFVTNNDNFTTITMNPFKDHCVQLQSDPTTIIWHWLSRNATDTADAANLTNHVGQTGYPVASIRYDR